MTEEEWQASDAPTPMLEFLLYRASSVLDRASARRLRLFACSWCRRLWPFLKHKDSRKAVEVSEQCADALISPESLSRASVDAQDVMYAPTGSPAWQAAWVASWDDAAAAAREISQFGWDWLFSRSSSPVTADQLLAEQSVLLRDIFGNPFRPVSFAAEWRTSTAVALASGMYESRDFSAMPILADALQDAGCDSPDVLDHCRDEKNTHVRGCWVIDLVLGKE